ncbi:hypothetical protein AB0M47_14045 [Hamadaea sp. NPDC051192]|uniref:hypothetical protein n=1 Tax=Hamadaea sp. NPDC051192 TaxID=3154940 RepID=UPI00343CA339
MTDYTDDERKTLRDAGFGAMMLVSQADPGFFAMFSESMAGAKAMAAAPAELRDLFKGGGLPSMPKGGAAEVESTVLGQLQQAVQILQAKSPQDVQAYKDVVIAACDQVAEAKGGVQDTETAMIAKVKAAVGA